MGTRWRSDELPVALILGAPRSGTTLLRMLLDAHHQVAAPAETGLPRALDELARAFWVLSPRGGQRFESKLLVDYLADRLRAAVIPPIVEHCARAGKQLYCDKSLDAHRYLHTVRAVFPDAKFIILTRHVMDVVVSGIEASHWGFAAYGYAPFVQASPGNVVVAVVRHWLSCVEPVLAWQQMYPESCHAVRYEDLVADVSGTLLPLLAFLEVDDESDVCLGAFGGLPRALGQGDYKAVHVDHVHADSVGRGRTVPISLLPRSLLESVNVVLSAFGYSPLDALWNVRGRDDDAVPASAAGQRLQSIMAHGIAASADPVIGRFAIVADDAAKLRWSIDTRRGSVTQGDSDVDFALVGATKDLVALLERSVSAGVMLQTGTVRLLGDAGPDSEPDAVGIAVEQVCRLFEGRQASSAMESYTNPSGRRDG